MAQERPLVYHMATTVDGYIARADGSYDFFPTDGDHIPDYIASLQQYGAVIMGRNTYAMGLAAGVTDPYPFLDTYVVSRSMTVSPHPHVQLCSGDVSSLVRDLKARVGRPIYLCGGARLASTLIVEGLVDQLILKQNPVLLGGGLPLTHALPRHIPLTLIDTKRYQSGVVLLTYDLQH